MLKLSQGLLHIAAHGKDYSSLLIVSLEVDADVLLLLVFGLV